MKKSHYEQYLPSFYLQVEKVEGDFIIEGQLTSKDDKNTIIPIIRGIPRFVNESNYSDNFGLQWNKFRSTQLDSYSGKPLTFNRFWNNTKWKPKELFGKTILEAGSGAGRFAEILLEAGAKVVSFDYSTAIDANYKNNYNKGDLFLFQGDIYNIPFPDNYFDYVFCYGVLQHTPNPQKAYKILFDKLKRGGKISIDYYLKTKYPAPWSTPKYLWRPITTKMEPEKLLKIIQTYIPIWLPIDTLTKKILYKIPLAGNIIAGLIPIPCWNYFNMGLSKKEHMEWAIMDTFDALGAKYDIPKTLDEIKEMTASPENKETDIFYGSNGIVANILKEI